MKLQLLPATLAGLASAQSLSDALGSQNASLSLLNSLLASQPGFMQNLSNAQNITVLAPNNNALNTLLNDSAQTSSDPGLVNALLNYHVLQGVYYASNLTSANASMFIPTWLDNQTYSNVTGGQRVEATVRNGNLTFITGMLQNSTVVTPNVNFTGGTIHIVDTVLTMPANDTTTALAANLTSFAGALNQSNAASNLSDTRDVTIFAPSNDAFNAIGNLAGNMSAEQLNSLVNYHVVPGIVNYSTGLSNGTMRSANGEDVQVAVDDNGDMFVNSAKIITLDLMVSNGVMHIIDNVLNPQNTTASPNPTASTQEPAFSGATSTAGIPFTSAVPSQTTTITATRSTASGGSGGGGGSTSSSSALAAPIKTGAVGAAALFGGAAMLVNF